jgi:hypothetical protein
LQPDLVVLAFFKKEVMGVSRNTRFREMYHGIILRYENKGQRQALRRYVDTHHSGRIIYWLFENFYVFRVAATARASPSSS